MAAACSAKLEDSAMVGIEVDAAFDATVDADARPSFAVIEAGPVSDASVSFPDAGPCAVVRDFDGGIGCGPSVRLPCGIEPSALPAACSDICGKPTWRCLEKSRASDGKVYEVTCDNCLPGRRPSGLSAASSFPSLVGWCEQMAMLEAASVTAFEYLHADLAGLGAPARMLRAIDDARHDEIRHAAIMASIATHLEGTVSAPEIRPYSPQSRVAIAIENAVEGCVRETFAALLAQWQGRHAKSGELRLAMRLIAGDELKHAALSWEIHSWLEPLLDNLERAQVTAAVRRAIDKLKCDAHVDLGASTMAALGLPNQREMLTLVEMLDRELWAQAAA